MSPIFLKSVQPLQLSFVSPFSGGICLPNSALTAALLVLCEHPPIAFATLYPNYVQLLGCLLVPFPYFLLTRTLTTDGDSTFRKNESRAPKESRQRRLDENIVQHSNSSPPVAPGGGGEKAAAEMPPSKGLLVKLACT